MSAFFCTRNFTTSVLPQTAATIMAVKPSCSEVMRSIILTYTYQFGCMYMYMYIHMLTYTHTCTCACICIYIHNIMYMYVATPVPDSHDLCRRHSPQNTTCITESQFTNAIIIFSICNLLDNYLVYTITKGQLQRIELECVCKKCRVPVSLLFTKRNNCYTCTCTCIYTQYIHVWGWIMEFVKKQLMKEISAAVQI